VRDRHVRAYERRAARRERSRTPEVVAAMVGDDLARPAPSRRPRAPVVYTAEDDEGRTPLLDRRPQTAPLLRRHRPGSPPKHPPGLRRQQHPRTGRTGPGPFAPSRPSCWPTSAANGPATDPTKPLTWASNASNASDSASSTSPTTDPGCSSTAALPGALTAHHRSETLTTHGGVEPPIHHSWIPPPCGRSAVVFWCHRRG